MLGQPYPRAVVWWADGPPPPDLPAHPSQPRARAPHRAVGGGHTPQAPEERTAPLSAASRRQRAGTSGSTTSSLSSGGPGQGTRRTPQNAPRLAHEGARAVHTPQVCVGFLSHADLSPLVSCCGGGGGPPMWVVGGGLLPVHSGGGGSCRPGGLGAAGGGVRPGAVRHPVDVRPARGADGAEVPLRATLREVGVAERAGAGASPCPPVSRQLPCLALRGSGAEGGLRAFPHTHKTPAVATEGRAGEECRPVRLVEGSPRPQRTIPSASCSSPTALCASRTSSWERRRSHTPASRAMH